MAIDAIVKFSQQSNTPTYQALNNALVGHNHNPTGPGPFERIGTAAYSCMNYPDDAAVLNALRDVLTVASQHVALMDSLQVSFVKRRGNDPEASNAE